MQRIPRPTAPGDHAEPARGGDEQRDEDDRLECPGEPTRRFRAPGPPRTFDDEEGGENQTRVGEQEMELGDDSDAPSA